MEVQAKAKFVRISPRKARLVVDLIRGKSAEQAVTQLSFLRRDAALPVQKLLKSAMANATNNNGLEAANLYILEIRVGDGLRLKRWSPRAFGRATPLLRRGSNVTIILEERIAGKNRTEKKKAEIETVTMEESAAVAQEIAKDSGKIMKPDMKKESKGIRPAAGKVVKKVFQRKSI